MRTRAYDGAVRKEEFEKFTRTQPFKPFEVRLVDGRRYRITAPEQFIVGRTTIVMVDHDGDYVLINLNLVATVHHRNGNGRKHA